MPKTTLKKERILLIVIFVIFLFLRIFSNSGYYFIQATDAARYLSLAKNFPYHTLDNNQLYVIHPPLYPYTIHFASLLFEDHIAGIFVSLISAVISFFIVYKLVYMLSNNRYVTLGTLVLFSLSTIYINISGNIAKESLSFMLTLGAIYYYVKFLKFEDSKNVVFSASFAAILGLTADYAILLIPSLIVIFLVFRKKVKILQASIPLISIILSYSIWLFVRLFTYIKYDYYPAALEGTIVKTSDWGLRQLVSPQYFKEVEIHVPFGISFDPFHYIQHILNMLNLVILPWPSGLNGNIKKLLSMNYAPQLVFYAALSIVAIYGVYKIINLSLLNGSKENGMLLSLLLFLIFLLPITQKLLSYRFTVTAIIFLFVIVNYGFYQLAKILKIIKFYKIGIIVLIFILVFYLPFYFSYNNHFILLKKKLVEIPKTSEFIGQLAKDGVMAKIGYTQELNYLTKKRVMALPIDTNHMFLIDLYNISYLMYGEFYNGTFEVPYEKDVSYSLFEYINNRPKEFKLLKVIKEDYPIINKSDNIYIYEVTK